MPTIEERVAAIEAKLQASPFDWSKFAAYLPAVRSLVWALGGMVAGGGLTGAVMPPKTVEGSTVTVTKEPDTSKIIEDFKRAFPNGLPAVGPTPAVKTNKE